MERLEGVKRVDASLAAEEGEGRKLHLVNSVEENLYDFYLSYTLDTESPAIYHRWGIISGIGALLGRNLYMQHGHFRIFPNLYTMFIGSTGSRKSTSIKLLRQVIAATGYDTFAADKTSKEKFLLDLEGIVIDTEDALTPSQRREQRDKITEQNLWGDTDGIREPKEVFICADEFNEFAGSGNMEFYTTLGNLWDWDSPVVPYKQRLKNSRSVSIYQPTVSILAGNTPENFARAFPPEIIGQGFLSRFVFIHGKRRERRLAFPPSPSPSATEQLSLLLRKLKLKYDAQRIELTVEAVELLTIIYESWQDLGDPRFSHYSNRRDAHLKKLCIITAAALWKEEIDLEVVLLANTILSAAETFMPKALGEFGKARNSDVANTVMDMLRSARQPLSFKDLWTVTSKDLDKPLALQELMNNLAHAEKIQLINGRNGGYLAKNTVRKEVEFVDFELLTEEEKEGVV